MSRPPLYLVSDRSDVLDFLQDVEEERVYDANTDPNNDPWEAA